MYLVASRLFFLFFICSTDEFSGRHDVDMPNTAEDTNWERIEANAQLLGEGDNPNRDCDVIHEFFSYILTRWGKALNARDETAKRFLPNTFVCIFGKFSHRKAFLDDKFQVSRG